jgi:hypothetical protein
MSELAKALTAAQKNFKPVPKTKTGQVGTNRKYKYADLADVLGMAIPILNAEGVFFSQTFKRDNDKLYLVTRLTKGSEVLEDAGLLIPEALSNQELGMRLTYIKRYSASSVLGISTEDDTDGVPQPAEDPSRSGQVTKQATPIIHQPSQGVQVTPAPKFVAKESDVPVNIGSAPTKEEMASIKESLKSLGIDNDKLKAYSLKVAGRTAVRDITRQEWQAIITGLTAAKTAGNLEQLVA